MSGVNPSALAVALVSAALLAGGAARGEDPPPGSGGALRIVADPPRLVLVGDAGAELRVAAPPEVEEVSLTASAGKIEGLKRLPGGGFVAHYRPPAQRVPQVAIVAAVARSARGVEDGWLAIPLSGRGTAKVRGAPGSQVTLRVGDRTFGPELADREGVATIPLIVPPGIREAHQGFRPIDLHIPETSLLHAVAERVGVHADREQKVRVVAYVVAPHGAARRGDAPVFEPSRGSVSVSEREAGAYVASWTLPPGPAGEERLVVRLPSAPASRSVVRVEAAPGPPALVAVAIDRAELVAGGEAATVTARTLDAAGNPVPGTLALEVRDGVLADVTPGRPGEVVARLTAGARLQGSEAVVTASAPALGISGARAVPLRPAAPAAGRFEARGLVRGDGVQETTLRVAFADRFGNPVSAAPEVTAEHGRIVAVSAAGPGAHDVRYVPPAVERPVEDTLVAQVGPVRATAAPLVAPPAPALRVEASAGSAVDVRGRFVRAGAGVALERPADVDLALDRGLEAALRVEAGGSGGGSQPGLATLLAGPSLRRARPAGAVWSASATAGLARSGDGIGPAWRLAVSAGLPRTGAEPFLELSLSGARPGGSGSYAAVGLSVGVRLGVEGRRDNHPDRR